MTMSFFSTSNKNEASPLQASLEQKDAQIEQLEQQLAESQQHNQRLTTTNEHLLRQVKELRSSLKATDHSHDILLEAVDMLNDAVLKKEQALRTLQAEYDMLKNSAD